MPGLPANYLSHSFATERSVAWQPSENAALTSGKSRSEKRAIPLSAIPLKPALPQRSGSGQYGGFSEEVRLICVNSGQENTGIQPGPS